MRSLVLPLSLLLIAASLGVAGSADARGGALKAPWKLKRRADAFKVYKLSSRNRVSEGIALKGVFDKKWRKGLVRGPYLYAAATRINGDGIADRNRHFSVYSLKGAPEKERLVKFKNRFTGAAAQSMVIGDASWFFVPAAKYHNGKMFPMSKSLDHFKMYRVLKGRSVMKSVKLADQFMPGGYRVVKPLFYGVPVMKKHGGALTKVTQPKVHMVVYEIARHDQASANIRFQDQFLPNWGSGKVYTSMWLAVPTTMLGWKELN